MDEPRISGQALLDFLDRPSHREPATVSNCRTYVRQVLKAAYGVEWADREFTKADVPWQLSHFESESTLGVDSVRSYQSGYASLLTDFLAWVTNRPAPARRHALLMTQIETSDAARRRRVKAFGAKLSDRDSVIGHVEPMFDPAKVPALVVAILDALSDEMLDHLSEALAP